MECSSCQKSVELLPGVESLPDKVFHRSNCIFVTTYGVNEVMEDGVLFCNCHGLLKRRSPIHANLERTNCRVEYAITDEEIEARLDSRKVNEVNIYYFMISIAMCLCKMNMSRLINTDSIVTVKLTERSFWIVHYLSPGSDRTSNQP